MRRKRILRRVHYRDARGGAGRDIREIVEECSVCGGTGKVRMDKTRCPICRGDGFAIYRCQDLWDVFDKIIVKHLRNTGRPRMPAVQRDRLIEGLCRHYKLHGRCPTLKSTERQNIRAFYGGNESELITFAGIWEVIDREMENGHEQI